MLINHNSPFYVKLAFKFLVIFFICFFIAVSQTILVPFAFAALLAVMLLPVANFLERRGISRVLSIALSLFFAIIFLALFIYFLSTQIALFVGDIPSIKQHLTEHFLSFQFWIKKICIFLLATRMII